MGQRTESIAAFIFIIIISSIILEVLAWGLPSWGGCDIIDLPLVAQQITVPLPHLPDPHSAQGNCSELFFTHLRVTP